MARTAKDAAKKITAFLYSILCHFCVCELRTDKGKWTMETTAATSREKKKKQRTVGHTAKFRLPIGQVQRLHFPKTDT